MEAKEFKITPPEGYEVDKEKSTLEHIVFKPVDKRAKTWKEIQELNRRNKINQYYLNPFGEIDVYEFDPKTTVPVITTQTHLNTERQAERVRALCQLYIIADYYNNGWEANWDNENEYKYIPCWNNLTNKFDWLSWNIWVHNSHIAPPFKSAEILLEAYENNKEIFETALKP